MAEEGYRFLEPPPIVACGAAGDRLDVRMSQLIREAAPGQAFDVGLIGVPLSRSSISPSAASENPTAIRLAWRLFASYNLDYDVDLAALRIADLGDVTMHVTDIPRCHANIEEAVVEALSSHPPFFPVFIGGDHSITCPIVKGLKRVTPGRTIGILQVDTHFDLRNLHDGGPSNGTPMRGLIESGTVVGSHIVTIGVHGHFNALAYKRYADEQGVRYYTAREVRRRGVEAVVEEALAYLRARVDAIYLTVDMDVLDVAFAPAAPASTPGGLATWDLLEAAYRIGREEKLAAMDLVCLDPHRDGRAQATVKTGAHVVLNVLCGYAQRIRQQG